MTTLDYLGHLRADSARFREVLAATDPDARVPSCPDWSAADLLWHLGEVQWFWASIVAERRQDPDGLEAPERPAGQDALLAFAEEQAARLHDALAAADPGTGVYMWSEDRTVGYIRRRQAHEALIHRLDAELTALGHFGDLDAALAADGVEEVLDVMYGASPEWGEFSPLDHRLRIDITDTGESIWVQIGRFRGTDPKDDVHYDDDDIRVIDDPGVEPDAVISGDAAPLVTRFWRRGDGAEIHLAGDLHIVDHFRKVIHQPIN